MDFRHDAPDVDAVRGPDHLEDLRFEFRERTPRERQQEEGHVRGADIAHASVQEPALQDLAGGPPPEPLLVLEPARVIPHVEDHAGLEEGVEVVLQGLDPPELFLEEERLDLRLVKHLTGLALPLQPLEVAGEHELEFLVDEEMA